ncbi:hypothetical protein FHS18_001170 [Paenibacillus phyllosphaerae]|uniref:Uncharacterized protein n=1 Tax=Paenibacillus phyllosphaerae TaxID=274593 RepID=A0A7W5AUW3_9BACL|nr:hypothetical protein [Paenibacillus phyllosphaerae]MBB3109118.1 hypothetical protein [Paenibacillus phyllosphaerae]
MEKPKTPKKSMRQFIGILKSDITYEEEKIRDAVGEEVIENYLKSIKK